MESAAAIAGKLAVGSAALTGYQTTQLWGLSVEEWQIVGILLSGGAAIITAVLFGTFKYLNYRLEVEKHKREMRSNT